MFVTTSIFPLPLRGGGAVTKGGTHWKYKKKKKNYYYENYTKNQNNNCKGRQNQHVELFRKFMIL